MKYISLRKYTIIISAINPIVITKSTQQVGSTVKKVKTNREKYVK